jgi:hypothetical protein
MHGPACIVWASLRPFPPVAQGGVGFQPQQIGWVLSITAVVVLFYQPCIFPAISNGLGVVRRRRATHCRRPQLLWRAPPRAGRGEG